MEQANHEPHHDHHHHHHDEHLNELEHSPYQVGCRLMQPSSSGRGRRKKTDGHEVDDDHAIEHPSGFHLWLRNSRNIMYNVVLEYLPFITV